MLAEPEEDGAALIDHLLAAERQTGQKPQMLRDAPQLPRQCRELWEMFRSLHNCRGNGGLGPMPITFTDLDAYQRVTRTNLFPWEIEAIRRADSAYMKRLADRTQT